MLKIMSFIIKLDTRFLLSTHKLPPTFRRTHARAHKHTNGSGIPRLSAEFLNLGPVKEPWWFPEGRELAGRDSGRGSLLRKDTSSCLLLVWVSHQFFRWLSWAQPLGSRYPGCLTQAGSIRDGSEPWASAWLQPGHLWYLPSPTLPCAPGRLGTYSLRLSPSTERPQEGTE